MTLFLILSAPLVGAAAYVLIGPRFPGFRRPRAGTERIRTVRNPVVIAAVMFIPLYLVHLVVSSAEWFPYSPGGLFTRALVTDYLGWFLLQSLLSYLVVRRLRNAPEGLQYLVHLIVAVVLLTFLSVAEVIGSDGFWTTEELFLRPLSRGMLLLLFPVGLTVADNARGGGWAVLLLFIQPFLAALAAMWFEWIRPGAAIVAAAVLVAATVVALWMLVFRRGADAEPTADPGASPAVEDRMADEPAPGKPTAHDGASEDEGQR